MTIDSHAENREKPDEQIQPTKLHVGLEDRSTAEFNYTKLAAATVQEVQKGNLPDFKTSC